MFPGTLVGRYPSVHLALVVQWVKNAIRPIIRYPPDKCWRNKLYYPVDSDLGGKSQKGAVKKHDTKAQ